MTFEWDKRKEAVNIKKHGVSFNEAKQAFMDPSRIIKHDILHSTANETRYFCLGRTEAGVLTVRYTLRDGTIRIFGAGYWRTGRKHYFAENDQEDEK